MPDSRVTPSAADYDEKLDQRQAHGVLGSFSGSFKTRVVDPHRARLPDRYVEHGRVTVRHAAADLKWFPLVDRDRLAGKIRRKWRIPL